MLKNRSRRIAALAGTLVALASVVALTIASTGAYFTASQPGQVNGSFGSVAVTVTGTGTDWTGADTAFSFGGMMPGEWRTAHINVTNTGTGNEDIYLAFTNANNVWSEVNTLGTYGEADVNGTNYNNLNNHWAQNTGPNTYTNACGDVVNYIRYLPHVNLLGTLTPGQNATYTFSFRYSACISNNAYQGQLAFSHPLEFVIAAFQPGVTPSDPHNGAGKIVDLPLVSGFYN